MAEGEGDVTNGVEEKSPVLNDQIVRQIEYYFGDINLPRDKFLQDQIKLEDGWVPLEVMLKFRRLSNLTTDTEVIVSALAASELMEVSEDKKKIRRNPGQPLPVFNEERRKELMTRTVYAKGFPTEGITLDMLLDFFTGIGPVDNVQMRSYKCKETNKFLFKGSVFVIFKTKELAEDFLQKEIKYEDKTLLTKWQSVYLEDKKKERQEKRNAKKSPANNVKQEKGEKVNKEASSFALGAFLHLKGLSEEITREDLKEKLINEGLDVAFLDFSKGSNEAWVRLLGENSAKNYAEKMADSKLELCGSTIEVRALEGEEEKTYLVKTREDMEKRREQNTKYKKRRGGRSGRGGRGGYFGKRKGSPVRGDTPVKKEAKEGETEGKPEEKAAKVVEPEAKPENDSD